MIVRIGERVLERTEHERQRRTELMTDVGEELGLQLIELGEFFALAGDLALVRLLLGNVAALGGDEDDVAVLVFDRAQRRVDDDGFGAALASLRRRARPD